ncbi:MAG: LETM1 domain-containing protein [Cyclobacteriaceae bacterium]|jgi:tellurite resistance protein|nr:LETM1 domain-containing protein [Cyclobacteriaceae bacterium]
MNKLEKGWLENYLKFRQDLLKQNADKLKGKSAHPEHSLYRILQPTGLMYGYSFSEETEKLDEKDKMKILLAESLIASALLYSEKPVATEEEFSAAIVKTLQNISNFYNNIFPELSTPAKTLFGKRKSPLELAEKILEKRIDRAGDTKGNFWAHFFHNSLLFLDVFIFGQWMHTNADKVVADFFRYERDELRFSVIKVMAAAAHASNTIEYEEKRLMEIFIQSTELSSSKRKEAYEIFNKGIDINEINLPAENSWILKRYFLEMAILTTWADRRIEKAEEDFLSQFSKYLGFHEDDLENSLIAIEGFVLEHWEQLEYLQNKQDYQLVSDHYLKRIAKIAEKNQGRLQREIQESEELSLLLNKSRTNELTETEKEQMRKHLIELLKTVPTLVIISLPQKFLTLPMLLKVLPKNVFEGGK